MTIYNGADADAADVDVDVVLTAAKTKTARAMKRTNCVLLMQECMSDGIEDGMNKIDLQSWYLPYRYYLIGQVRF